MFAGNNAKRKDRHCIELIECFRDLNSAYLMMNSRDYIQRLSQGTQKYLRWKTSEQ